VAHWLSSFKPFRSAEPALRCA